MLAASFTKAGEALLCDIALTVPGLPLHPAVRDGLVNAMWTLRPGYLEAKYRMDHVN